jgi:hypothetical protein
MNNKKIVVMGGHQSTRPKIIANLEERGFEVSELPSTEERRTSFKKSKSKLTNCDLIVVITGHLGHNNTDILFKLKQSKTISSEQILIVANCKGESGVVRSILAKLNQTQKVA